jgi:signal transduction histidine kinase/ligand-binding sensor domain-containing protein/DNA-binding NarL/FixJ family response regulator
MDYVCKVKGKIGMIAFMILFLNIFCFGTQRENGRVLNYTLKQGLSFGIVNSIVQDDKGLMWFATSDGLNQFDGRTFKIFKFNAEDQKSLSGNYIKSIFKDKEGVIWVSSRKGLNEFLAKKEQFIRHNLSPYQTKTDTDVSDISQARNGDLWLSLNGNGFCSFDRKNKKATYYNRTTLPILSTNSVLNIFEDSNNLLWVGTRDSGLEVFRIDKNRNLTKTALDLSALPNARINKIYEDHRGDIWIASSKGLIFFKRSTNKFYILKINTIHGNNICLSLIQDQKKRLLIGVQDGGLYSLDLNNVQEQNPAQFSFEPVKNSRGEGITQRSVQSLFLDKDQNIWLGTYGEGVYLISSIAEKFQHFEKKFVDERADGYLRYYGMCTDKEGNLWLGTDGNGIYKTKSTGEVIKHYPPTNKPGGLSDGAVISAYRDSGGNLWFGTYSKGLFLYNPLTDSFTQYANNPANKQSLPVNDVRVIFEDSKKTIWVGTNGGGLCRMDRAKGTFSQFIPSNSSINSNDVRAITEDTRGNLWIGTYGGGLNYLIPQTMKFASFLNDPGKKFFLSNRIIFSLYFDKKERLFIGSEGNGLLVVDTKTKKAKLFSENNGLANDVINAIQAESEDKIWVSTNKGLSRINLTDATIENFDRSNGLQSGQFNPGSALYHEKEKFICFGGTEGWNLFYPDQIKSSQYRPRVLVTGIELLGKDMPDGSKKNENSLSKQITDQTSVTLDPKQNVFSVVYTALNYAYPERSKFAYMLEGLDKDWNYVLNEHAATYRYLPAGDYTFKVKASNQDGIWSDDFASVDIRILPPWYQTWWAYLLYATAIILAFYYYQQYKIRQANLQYEIKLAHFETQKEKELNEKKISFFTHISHEFRTPLTLIINPAKELLKENNTSQDGASLNIIYRNAKRLLSLVDQLLLFRKAEQKQDSLTLAVHNLPELIREVFQYFSIQAEHKHIDYAFSCTHEDLEITVDREKIEIALFNLISNAIKFTPENGRVSISLTETDQQVQILVSDTGPGIPLEAREKIFSVFHQYADSRFPSKGGFGIGLFLARTFTESHFGTLTYDSVPDGGTTFNMTLWKQHPALLADSKTGIQTKNTSVLLEELAEVPPQETTTLLLNGENKPVLEELSEDTATLLIVDDDTEIRQYLRHIFSGKYKLLEAVSGEEGLMLVKRYLPDIIISDVMMGGISGIEMCAQLKADVSLSHIPVVLLTASSSTQVRLQGIEGGADDYISKPFDKDLLVAKITSILKNRSDLQKYFFNEITLQNNDFKISAEYKEFLKNCISIVENHLMDPSFNIKVLAAEIGMSHSTLYNRIKSISGQSTNGFIRFIRLRRAAEILITTDTTISETAYQVGINDIKYFRAQFNKLFGMKPSEYIKKYRKPFHENQLINKDVFRNKMG